jgi:hypothetical protein
MIFPVIETEAIVQVNDKTRLSAIKTYGAKGADPIEKVEIEPEAGAGFIDVTDARNINWFTDWSYATPGNKTVTLQINGDTTPVVSTQLLIAISEADDQLFASDQDLIMEEPDVLKYVKAGRATFKDVHREVQSQIIYMLNRKGYRAYDGTAITKDLVVDHTQVREMARYWALMMIYNAQSNQVGDIFSVKSQDYSSKLNTAIQKQVIGLDLNKDGDISLGEGVSIHVSTLFRR